MTIYNNKNIKIMENIKQIHRKKTLKLDKNQAIFKIKLHINMYNIIKII